MKQQSGIEKYPQQLKGDLGVEIAAQKDSPVKYGSEFHNIASLEKLFFHQ